MSSVSVPLWFLTSLPALPLMIGAVLEIRARRQSRKGLCRHCGYDLRATPQRCPECGMAPERDRP